MTIFAAGCVVYRRGTSGLELLLVHRDRYDDWTFPKGKRDKGETDKACALREVAEETGFSGQLGAELTPSRYLIPRKKKRSEAEAKPKVVRWWLLEASAGEFVPNDEVDAITWVNKAQARVLLSYQHDRDLLAESALRDLETARK